MYMMNSFSYLVAMKRKEKEEIPQSSALGSTSLCFMSLWAHLLKVMIDTKQGNLIY